MYANNPAACYAKIWFQDRLGCCLVISAFSSKQTLTLSWHKYNSLAYTFAIRSGDMKAPKKHIANATN